MSESTLHPTPSAPEGLPKGPQTLRTRPQIRDAGIHMVQGASRELLLFGRTLDPSLYDQVPFLEGVRRLALERRDLPVRILLFDLRSASQTDHRIIPLAQRLTSRIEIRRIAKEDEERLDAFMIVDERSYLYRPIADEYNATVDFDGAYKARLLRAEFIDLWERGSPETELRRLHL